MIVRWSKSKIKTDSSECMRCEAMRLSFGRNENALSSSPASTETEKKTCHWLAWRQSHAIYKSKLIATHTRSGRRIISIDHEQEKLNVVNCCVCQVRIDRANNFCYFIAVSMRCPVECKSLPLLWQSHVVWFGWHRSVNLLYGERDFIGVAVAMVSAASGSRSLSKRQFDQRPSTFQSFRMRTPYRYLYIYNNNACITRSGSNFKTIRKLMSEIINQNSQ